MLAKTFAWASGTTMPAMGLTAFAPGRGLVIAEIPISHWAKRER